MCSRLGSVPKAMLIDINLDGDFIEEYWGNSTTVFKGKYKGRQVAMKMLRIYLISNRDECHGVSITTLCVAEPLADTGIIEVFSRSCCMETSPAPECTAVVRYNSGSGQEQAHHDIRMDDSRQHQ